MVIISKCSSDGITAILITGEEWHWLESDLVRRPASACNYSQLISWFAFSWTFINSFPFCGKLCFCVVEGFWYLYCIESSCHLDRRCFSTP